MQEKTFVDDGTELEDETEQPEETPPRLGLSIEDIADFTAEHGGDIARLHDAAETAELAVEYLKFEPNMDVVGRIFSVEMVPSKFVQPNRPPEMVPVLVFLGSRRVVDKDGVVTEDCAMFRCYAKAAMSVLIAQPRGFEFRLRATARETLSDGRTRWTLSIRALRKKAHV